MTHLIEFAVLDGDGDDDDANIKMKGGKFLAGKKAKKGDVSATPSLPPVLVPMETEATSSVISLDDQTPAKGPETAETEAGLLSSAGEQVPLRGVYVRANLLGNFIYNLSNIYNIRNKTLI